MSTFRKRLGKSASESNMLAAIVDPQAAPSVPAPRHDLRVLQSLRRIIRQTEMHSRNLAAQYKITGPQLVCLHAIQDEGRVTVSRISQAVFLSPSTVVGILDRLAEKSLVVRTRDEHDRRKVYVTLSEKGKELVAHAPSPLHDRLYAAFQNLPELEQATIALSLERVVQLMEAEQIDAAPILESGALNQSVEVKELLSKVEDLE